MNARLRTLLVATVVASAVCSGGCSRSVPVCVRNDFPFPIFVHERTVWRNMPRTSDSGRIAPQDISLAAEIGRGEIMRLQVVDSKGQFLCQATVNAGTAGGLPERYRNRGRSGTREKQHHPPEIIAGKPLEHLAKVRHRVVGVGRGADRLRVLAEAECSREHRRLRDTQMFITCGGP